MTPNDEMSTGMDVALSFNLKSKVHDYHSTSLKTPYSPITLNFSKAHFQAVLTLKSVHRKEKITYNLDNKGKWHRR